MLNYKHLVPLPSSELGKSSDYEKYISDSGTLKIPKEVWSEHKRESQEPTGENTFHSNITQQRNSKKKAMEKTKRTMILNILKDDKKGYRKSKSQKESMEEELGETFEEPIIELFKEISYLGSGTGSRNNSRELRSQASYPEDTSAVRQTESTTLGMGALNYAPLKLKRVYGRNENIPIFNLCGILKSHVAYAASNVVVYYDYYENRQSLLQGHKNKITCLTQDRSHQYLASGAVGKSNLTIVWDIESAYPFKIFPAYSDPYGSYVLGFSEIDYLATIGFDRIHCESIKNHSAISASQYNPNGNFGNDADLNACTGEQVRQVIKFWSLKEKSRKMSNIKHVKIRDIKPVMVGILPHGTHKHRELVFSHENSMHFLTTGDKSIYFYTWLQEQNLILYHIPKTYRKFLGKIIHYRQSIWIKGSTVLTTTSGGLVLEWQTPVPIGLQEPIDPAHNVKEYKRSYKISEVGLTAICSYKDFYVIGDEAGNIKFFDHHFRIVRWTKTLYDQPISNISFNLLDETPDWKLEMRANYKQDKVAVDDNETFGRRSFVGEYTKGGTKIKKISETTIERKELVCNDLVVSTHNGNIFYYHMNEGVIDRLIHGTFGPIVALDTSPHSNHIVISNSSGDVQMYDTVHHNPIFSGRIFRRKVEVTYLKFHPSSSFILFGTAEGMLFFRRSFTFGAMGAPLDNCQYPIKRVVFSSCGMYLSHFDASHAVTLYAYHSRRGTWQLKGKLRSHYRPIVDLMWFLDSKGNNQRLFSLGEDRRLLEYDVMGSGGSVGLKVVNVSYTEQINIPTAMSYDNPFSDEPPILIFANSDNKIRLYDQNCHKIRRTCQGPNYGTVISRMIPYAPASYKNLPTKFIIILLSNKIGLIKTPVDGNPFKYMAILGHPFPIIEACVGHEEQVYTCAMNDNCCFLWKPNIQALETSTLSGGSGSLPFRQIIDAGLPPGRSTVEDIENIFYHLMIKRAQTQEELLGMNVEIKIDDIPTVMRTCGFFLTEFQIDAIMEEAVFMLSNRGHKNPTYIGFDDFLILFANHKTYPITHDDVIKSFEVLGEYNEQDELCIGRNKFLECITKKCEAINELDLPLFIPSMYTSDMSLADEAKSRIPIRFDLGDHSNYPSEYPSQTEVKNSRVPSFRKSPETATSTKTGDTFGFAFDPTPKIELLNLDADSIGTGESEATISEEEPHTRHLPLDIKAQEFIEQLLTDESYDTIQWSFSTDSDMKELGKLQEHFNETTGMKEVLERWQKRDQWRYFTTAFKHLEDPNIHFTAKLKIAVQLDRFAKTGILYDIDEMLRQMRLSSTEETGERSEDSENLVEPEVMVIEQESMGFVKSGIRSKPSDESEEMEEEAEEDEEEEEEEEEEVEEIDGEGEGDSLTQLYESEVPGELEYTSAETLGSSARYSEEADFTEDEEEAEEENEDSSDNDPLHDVFNLANISSDTWEAFVDAVEVRPVGEEQEDDDVVEVDDESEK